MNTDTTKKVQAAEVTFADDAFSPLPEGALDQDQIYGEISKRISRR